MALVILAKMEFSTQWYVGQDNPVPNYETDDITEIQADGQELDFIVKVFSITPPLNRKVVRFFGDQAKYIVGNLTT